MTNRDNQAPQFAQMIPDPPVDLANRVLWRIHAEEERLRLRRHTRRSRFLAVASATTLVPIFGHLIAAFSQSGFAELVSLMFTDPVSTISLRSSYLPLLLETVPLAGLAVFGGTLWLLLFMLRSLDRNLTAWRTIRQSV